MKLIPFINKNKNKLFNLAVLIIAFIIASNIYKYQTKKLEALKKRSDMEKRKNAVIENISGLEKSIDAYKNFLVKKDASSVINTISNIAKESRIRIISIRPTSEHRYPDYIKLPFDLSFTAPNYHTLAGFISKIETYQDVYVVEAIEIRSQEQANELAVNLTVSSVAFTPLQR